MEGRVHVPVVLETADEPICSVSASSETPRQGLGRAIPSYAYVSHDWQGMAKGAMGRRSNHLFTIPY